MTGKKAILWGKRASERDILFIVALTLAFGLIALMVIKFVSMTNTQVQTMDSVPTIGKTVSSTLADRMPKWMDGAFIALYVLLMVVALILALMVQTNPIFFPISLIYMVFIVIISRIAGVIWSKLAASPDLVSQAANLPIMSFMMPKLHIFSFVIGIFILMLMVVKRQ